jgi:hypothetical protein
MADLMSLLSASGVSRPNQAGNLLAKLAAKVKPKMTAGYTEEPPPPTTAEQILMQLPNTVGVSPQQERMEILRAQAGVNEPQQPLLGGGNYPQLNLPESPKRTKPTINPLTAGIAGLLGIVSPENASQFGASALQGDIQSNDKAMQDLNMKYQEEFKRRTALYQAESEAQDRRDKIDVENQSRTYNNSLIDTRREMKQAEAGALEGLVPKINEAARSEATVKALEKQQNEEGELQRAELTAKTMLAGLGVRKEIAGQADTTKRRGQDLTSEDKDLDRKQRQDAALDRVRVAREGIASRKEIASSRQASIDRRVAKTPALRYDPDYINLDIARKKQAQADRNFASTVARAQAANREGKTFDVGAVDNAATALSQWDAEVERLQGVWSQKMMAIQPEVTSATDPPTKAPPAKTKGPKGSDAERAARLRAKGF